MALGRPPSPRRLITSPAALGLVRRGGWLIQTTPSQPRSRIRRLASQPPRSTPPGRLAVWPTVALSEALASER